MNLEILREKLLIIHRGKIDADDIAVAIEWGKNDNFWRSNIL